MYFGLNSKESAVRLFVTSQSKYFVTKNTKLELYDDVTVSELNEEHLPNYLIINEDTGAIEFAVDQLPAAIQVANKLEMELLTLTSGNMAPSSELTQ